MFIIIFIVCDSCPFIFALQRCAKPVFIKITSEIVSFPGKGLYMVTSVKANALIEIESFGSDRVIFHVPCQIDALLFDVAISPSSWHIIEIDCHWVLRIFEMGVSTLSRQLEVTNKIPMISLFLVFDQFVIL